MTTFLGTVRKFAKPSICLEKRDLEHVHRASEIIRVFTAENAKRFIQRHADKTMLMQYGSDLTPLITRETYRSVSDDASVIRHGKGCHEFLIERLFLVTREGLSCAVLEDPLLLDHKTAYYHFCAYRKFA